MRHFSVTLLVLCMLLPPVMYLATVVVLEQQVQDRFTRAIEDASTGDPQPLLEGSVRLRDVLRTNIDAFLRASALVRYGSVGPGQRHDPGRGRALSLSVRRGPGRAVARQPHGRRA